MNRQLSIALLNDHRLSPNAVFTYMYLYHMPQQTIRSLVMNMGLSRSTVRRAVVQLLDSEWIFKDAIKAPHGANAFIPWMPQEIETVIADEITRMRNEVPYVGEWLMKCWLDIMVSDRDFWDNARPPWLVTRDGSGRLEFDRWYRSVGVALEFQGQQHFKTGNHFSTTNTELQRRTLYDDIKAGICHRHGITCIEITGAELSPTTLHQKLVGIMPLVPLKQTGQIYRTLSKLCRSYVNTVIRSNQKDDHRQAHVDVSSLSQF